MTETKKPTLNALVAHNVTINHLIYAADGEITAEMEKAFDVTNQAIREKLESYHFVIAQMEAQEQLLKKQEAAFAAAKKRAKAGHEWLTEKIRSAMIEMNTPKLECGFVKYSISKSQGSLKVDETKLPDAYFIIETVRTPDTKRIKEALEAGEEIEGAAIVPGTVLRTSVAAPKIGAAS